MMEKEVSLNKLFLKDLVCGSFAGVVVCVTGHPLDSIKVRMQVKSEQKLQLAKIMKDMYRFEGARGFYKGMGTPLVTVPLVNSIVFSSYEFCKRFLGVKSEKDFTVTQSIISGMFAGFVNSFVLSPIELVKCRLQIQKESKVNAYYKGPTDVVVKILQGQRPIQNLFRGTVITIIREVPCYAAQFGGYYLMKQFLLGKQKNDKNNLNLPNQLIAGGWGGFWCWFFSYPQDVIKTRLQIARIGQYQDFHFGFSNSLRISDGGIINCSKQIYFEDKFYGFWKGFSVCAARSIIVHACKFLAYEFSQKRLTLLLE